MNDLLGMLSQQVGGQVAGQMSSQLGIDAGTTESAINAALPMLLGCNQPQRSYVRRSRGS